MIGACCPALEMLDITGCDAVADVGLVQLAVSCPLLKRLFLSESNDTEAGRARVKVKELCPRIMVEYFGVGERQVGADDREVTITEAMDGSDELVVQFSGGDTGVYDKSALAAVLPSNKGDTVIVLSGLFAGMVGIARGSTAASHPCRRARLFRALMCCWRCGPARSHVPTLSTNHHRGCREGHSSQVRRCVIL